MSPMYGQPAGGVQPPPDAMSSALAWSSWMFM